MLANTNSPNVRRQGCPATLGCGLLFPSENPTSVTCANHCPCYLICFIRVSELTAPRGCNPLSTASFPHHLSTVSLEIRAAHKRNERRRRRSSISSSESTPNTQLRLEAERANLHTTALRRSSGHFALVLTLGTFHIRKDLSPGINRSKLPSPHTTNPRFRISHMLQTSYTFASLVYLPSTLIASYNNLSQVDVNLNLSTFQ